MSSGRYETRIEPTPIPQTRWQRLLRRPVQYDNETLNVSLLHDGKRLDLITVTVTDTYQPPK